MKTHIVFHKIKANLKVVRSMDTLDSYETIIDGYVVHWSLCSDTNLPDMDSRYMVKQITFVKEITTLRELEKMLRENLKLIVNNFKND